jgi:hypothetical protein
MTRSVNMPEADYRKFKRSRNSLERICPLVAEAKKHTDQARKKLNKAYMIAVQLDNRSSAKEKGRQN